MPKHGWRKTMDILIDLCVEGADNLESEGWTENAAAVRLAIDEILRLRAHGAALAHVLSLLAPPPAPPHEPHEPQLRDSTSGGAA